MTLDNDLTLYWLLSTPNLQCKGEFLKISYILIQKGLKRDRSRDFYCIASGFSILIL